MRKIVLMCVAALAAAGPAHASEGAAKGRELKISGSVVKASTTAVSVKSLVGNAVLTCAVPGRLAQNAASLKVGDNVRMYCVRYRGRRAQLVKIQRVPSKPEKPVAEKQQAGPAVGAPADKPKRAGG